MSGRGRRNFGKSDGLTCILGLGEDRPSRPGSAVRSGSPFTNRTNSPFTRATRAGDSSQMMDALCQPPSPDGVKAPVVEDVCVEENVHQSAAIPFFEHPKKDKILIKDGKVVNADSVVAADVLIEDGVIVQIEEGGIEDDGGAKVIDATGKYVLPGGVDPSVYAGASMASTSKCAIIGGTTTLVEYVVVDVAHKGESVVEAFNEAKAGLEASSVAVSVVLALQVNGWNQDAKAGLEELVKEQGVNTLKLDLTGFSGGAGEVVKCLESCRDLGVAVHATGYNSAALKISQDRVLAKGTTGPEGHLISRPEDLELDAMNRACAMAREAKVPVVLNGISCTPTTDLVSDGCFGQICSASLALDGSHLFNSCWTHAASFVSEPPLRDDPDTPSKLVEAVVNKSSNMMVCSHHKPLTLEQRSEMGGQANFSLIPKGLTGARERVPIVWNGVVGGGEEGCGDPETAVALASTNAAKALNLYPKKGCLAVGSDADVLVIDPEGFQSFDHTTSKDTADFNIYTGLKVQGKIDCVVVMGKVMAYGDEFNEEASSSADSEFLTPAEPFPAFLYKSLNSDQVDGAPSSAVSRNLPRDLIEETPAASQTQSSPPAGFGKTTPRCGSAQAGSQLNKSLGVYQRPMSAHGIRNQQDSTFSLAGGYNDNGPSRRAVKISSPPGGSQSGSFW